VYMHMQIWQIVIKYSSYIYGKAASKFVCNSSVLFRFLMTFFLFPSVILLCFVSEYFATILVE